MNYSIEEVMVGQIVVQFENGERYVVGVPSEATIEQIDMLVGQQDPSFVINETVNETVNPNVKVGETRAARQFVYEEYIAYEPDTSEDVISDEEPEPESESPQVLQNGTFVAAALYHQSLGDSRVMDALMSHYETIYGSTSVDVLLEQIQSSTELLTLKLAEAKSELNDEIFNLAMEELDNG